MRVFPFRLSIIVLLFAWTLAAPVRAGRTIEFETTEVTLADVTLSPDGQWLSFTMLGHLFRLPVEGGTAEQLTFGPYYDTDPVFSPDGKQVAFVSDRDGSQGNIFVLELATGQITQVTHESWVRGPTWTPDGQAIAYLRVYREEEQFPVANLVRRVALQREPSGKSLGLKPSGRALSGGEPETISALPRPIYSVFYLPDGRLAWTLIEPEQGSLPATTRIEVMSPQGTVSTLRTLTGATYGRVVSSPTGDGLYWRRLESYLEEHLVFSPLPEGAERFIVPLARPRWWRPGFAVADDNRSLYVGDAGRLWKIALPSGAREHIPFRARVKLDIQDLLPPPNWTPATLGSSAPPRSILHPRLSPDGRSLVFEAAGYLWQQSLDSAPGEPSGGGQATRLFEGSAFEQEPAFSPDGRQLAFIRSEYGNQEVRVFDFESRQERTLASGLRYQEPSWTSDGQRLVFTEYENDAYGYAYGLLTASMVAVNLSDGKKEKLTDRPGGRWSPRPHISADSQSLYFSANITGTGTLYRLPLKGKAKPQPVTQLARHLNDGLISPDGKWLAFRRNTEIWVASLGTEPVEEKHVHQLSPEGGDTFAFTADSSAVIYAAGNRVWRHPLPDGEREEIPIRLELQRPTPPPLLLRQVRVLDFARGDFAPETSLYIEQGRIRWIGSERGRKLPRETLVVDGAGRFAIPGLFEMHGHVTGGSAKGQEAFLAYGVTSVRDVGNWLAWMNALADRSEATSRPVPRYFYAELFEGPQGQWIPLLRIHNEDEARTYVRRTKERGAHFIKAYYTLPGPLHRAVAEEARRQNLPVVGHGRYVEEITSSVTLGYASLEHTSYPIRLYEDVLQMLAAAGTRWDPTAGSDLGNRLLARDEPERLADAKLRAFASEPYIRTLQTGRFWQRARGEKAVRGQWVELLASIRAAHRRGVKLLAGSHALANQFVLSLHWELEFFVQAGIPSIEVLRIATQQAAEAVGAQGELGTLEPGKLADIVLLDKDPLEDIRNTQTIWRVIKGGWLFDPEKLRPPESTGRAK